MCLIKTTTKLKKDAPNYEAFKQSDEYAKTINQMGAAVVVPMDIGGTTYNFGSGVEADAYKAYMSRMGVDVKSGGSQSSDISSGMGMNAGLFDPRTVDYSGMTYEQALTRQMQQDVKSPEEQRAINLAIRRGPMQGANKTGTGDMVDIVTEMEEAAAGNTTGMPTVTPTFVAETPGTVMTGDGTELGAAPHCRNRHCRNNWPYHTNPHRTYPGLGQVGGVADVSSGLAAMGPQQQPS